jgi:hypothetical protein
MQDLKKWFAKAKLLLKLERRPPTWVGNSDIFQLSIATKGSKNKREIFRLFPGDEENEVRVVDVDPEKQQLILLVNEPSREFVTEEWNSTTKRMEKIKHRTPNFTRRYLLGMDEAHLFIAELPQEGAINKVKEAHEILKPEYVIKSEKETNRIKRQGEWFFIPVTTKEQNLIEENENSIKKKQPIGGANPHIADQLIRIDDEIYVKGKIKHVEHRTLKLNGWFRVLRNTEVTSRTRVFGWID